MEAGAAAGWTPGIFVDRVLELAELRGGLDATLAGRGRLFLLAGEPGIGKTRLAATVADEAARAGAQVAWGRAWEAGGAPAYWPWIQVVRALARERDDAELLEDLGTGAAYVAHIAPELHARLPDLSAAPPLDSDQARFSAWDAFTRFLRAGAARRPVVAVVDDLHAADVASLLLLEFVARALADAPVLVLGTYRVVEARRSPEVGTVLARVGREGHRLVLGGLDAPDVAEVVAAHAHGPPGTGLAERVHRLTAGNPLYVDELLRLLAAEGRLEEPERLVRGRLPLPDGVRETLRRRLEPLGSEAMETLLLAAVIGPRFRLETLARAAGMARPDVLGRLEEATRVGLVEEDPDEVGTYAFTHALVREVLYDDLSGRERATAHGRVADALAELVLAQDLGPAELAHHYLIAAPAGDPEPAVTWGGRAGAQAMATLAYEQAAEHFRGALRALELLPADPARRGPLLLALGEAQFRAGSLVAGRATLREAGEAARQAGDAPLLARAALAYAPWGSTGLAVEEELAPLLEEALDRLGDDDAPLRARLLARLAEAGYWTEPGSVRQARAEQAIAIARRGGDGRTLAAVLNDAHLATWDPDSADRALPWSEEALTLAAETGDLELEVTVRAWRIPLLLELGDAAAAGAEVEAHARLAEVLRQPRALAQVALHAAHRAVLDARFEDAQLELEEAARRAADVEQDELLVMRIAAITFAMRSIEDRLPELEPAVRAFAEGFPAMPVWRCALLVVLAQTGREDEARRAWERLAADDFSGIPRDNLWLPAIGLLAEACAQLGDAPRARVLRALLAPYTGRNVVSATGAVLSPVDRYLALLAATAGDRTGAAAAFAAARAMVDRLGAPALAAPLERDEARLGGLGPAPRRAGRGRLVRRADVWEVAWREGSAFHVRDAKGLHHLARLLAVPGVELHALDLVGGASGRTGPAPPGLVPRGRGQDDAGPALDARAKAEYRRRVEELREDLEEAEAFGDVERTANIREELEYIGAELSAAVGLGGRDRRIASAAERARVNVTRALKGAVDRLAREDPALGHHLRSSVHTGTFCRYEPGPDAPMWEL